METTQLHAYLDAIEADNRYYSLKIGYLAAETCGTPYDAYTVTLEFSDSLFLKIGVVDGHPFAWINHLTLWNETHGGVETITLPNPMLHEIVDRFDLLPLVKHVIEDAHPRDFSQVLAPSLPLNRHISI